MFNEFKKFILRGSVVDLAVGIAIGAAFTNVANALVKDIINPLISVILGERKFANAHFTINGADFLYGDLINSVITFLLVATVVFFLVVKPINKLSDIAFKSKKTDEPDTRKCPYCLGVIPSQATKCMHCGSSVSKQKK
ncbi:large conductance mechanosensitive channel protein MscL [Candidatus Saccharibacteria bacterium]|nr:large conductance mechanosensitive channel protein MscL [Candidatus Saccharibacteria bacterium]